MTPYERDRKRADTFTPAIKQIVGPHLLVPTPNEIDCKQAADLMIFTARDMMIAARVRKHKYLASYRYQFTIRAWRDSGATTELAKIVDGWADWFLYAFADAADQALALWWLIDLHAFRAALIRNSMNGSALRCGDSSNGDGTYFKWFDLRSFPSSPPILVAGSEPLPGAANDDRSEPISNLHRQSTSEAEQLSLGLP
jgi:hypothetical protein